MLLVRGLYLTRGFLGDDFVTLLTDDISNESRSLLTSTTSLCDIGPIILDLLNPANPQLSLNFRPSVEVRVNTFVTYCSG